MDLGHLVLTMLLLVAVLEVVLERRAGARLADEREAAQRLAAEWKAAATSASAAWERSLNREMHLLAWKARHFALVKRYAVPVAEPTQKVTVN